MPVIVRSTGQSGDMIHGFMPFTLGESIDTLRPIRELRNAISICHK